MAMVKILHILMYGKPMLMVPFHSINNSNGVIQMGLAENQLCSDLVHEWILNSPKPPFVRLKELMISGIIAIFQDYRGLPEGNHVGFDLDLVAMSGGATGAHEMIAFCLADPCDAFLVPVPYYPGVQKEQPLDGHCDIGRLLSS
ncbi:hypothetical protein FEM48_Zijuj11G0029100 [Ziziphus jujuba var. spinosa]|uniref:Aminotransferase class I/classII large domain-containing protein n=1 Tax=Ziziphus jujuba var. spinosa TaxID=714518 RepID=A0A978UGE4_ZIZJJ|nr:hypothetical protein FEM48_Zijuj11G0029100 [Ziziphus jujuba var. spinosa]